MLIEMIYRTVEEEIHLSDNIFCYSVADIFNKICKLYRNISIF